MSLSRLESSDNGLLIPSMNGWRWRALTLARQTFGDEPAMKEARYNAAYFFDNYHAYYQVTPDQGNKLPATHVSNRRYLELSLGDLVTRTDVAGPIYDRARNASVEISSVSQFLGLIDKMAIYRNDDYGRPERLNDDRFSAVMHFVLRATLDGSLHRVSHPAQKTGEQIEPISLGRYIDLAGANPAGQVATRAVKGYIRYLDGLDFMESVRADRLHGIIGELDFNSLATGALAPDVEPGLQYDE